MPKSQSRRKRRTEAQWTEILRRFESSSLGAREFCRREGLALSSFQRWRGRIAEPSSRTEFVELVPSSAASPTGWALELTLPNGVCLRLRG